MNWDAIGAVGEIISAIAVLATLVYVALQVKRLSADVYSAHLSRIDEGERDLRRLKLEHAGVLAKAATGSEGLTEIERMQLSEIYRSHEAFFFFGYLRAISSGGNELIHAYNFAEALIEYPAFLPIYQTRNFAVLNNPDRIRFGELVKQRLEESGT